MRLVSVYERPDTPQILYDLLAEREPQANISHKQMPTIEEHLAFMASKPYLHWLLIEDFGVSLGAIYLTKQDEIGLAIFKQFQGQGWGTKALAEFKRLVPRERYFANVAPANLAGQSFWLKHGFKLKQVTYVLSNTDE